MHVHGAVRHACTNRRAYLQELICAAGKNDHSAAYLKAGDIGQGLCERTHATQSVLCCSHCLVAHGKNTVGPEGCQGCQIMANVCHQRAPSCSSALDMHVQPSQISIAAPDFHPTHQENGRNKHTNILTEVKTIKISQKQMHGVKLYKQAKEEKRGVLSSRSDYVIGGHLQARVHTLRDVLRSTTSKNSSRQRHPCASCIAFRTCQVVVKARVVASGLCESCGRTLERCWANRRC
jgi:hypothetical protein